MKYWKVVFRIDAIGYQLVEAQTEQYAHIIATNKLREECHYTDFAHLADIKECDEITEAEYREIKGEMQ